MGMNRRRYGVVVLAAFAAVGVMMSGQATQPAEPAAKAPILPRPDPKETPLPVIKTDMKPMPGVDQLPDRPEMPDVMR